MIIILRPMHLTKLTIYILALLSIASCSRNTRLDRLFEQASPYEKYLQRLEKHELDQTALGRDWIEAGQQSLQDSLLVTLPYQETTYFSPEAPQALSLRYRVQEGQQVYVKLKALSQPEAQIFINIFEAHADSSLHSLHHADSLPQLRYEVESQGWHLLRIQPELLRGGAYTLEVGFQPSLDFPVSGKDSRAVQSFFGAPRDGGSRSHRGIDIFAPKGTPVLAVADGMVSRRTSSGRGGKMVWLSSPKKRFNLYYAHLDSQTVAPGQRVQVGDTLGFVGNTGNARTTPPHLHFSIYRFGSGAVDPFPFVHALPETEPLLAADPAEIGVLARTSASLANIRHAPNLQSEIVGNYPRHTWLKIEGKSGKWFRIALPDQQKAYIHQSLVEPLLEPLEELDIRQDDKVLFAEDYAGKAVDESWLHGPVKVLAVFDSAKYIQSAKGFSGWIREA